MTGEKMKVDDRLIYHIVGLGLELLLQEGHLALGDPTLLRRQYGGSLTNRAAL